MRISRKTLSLFLKWLRWNEEFVFDVNVKNAEGEFHINLFDHDFVGKDDWLGMIIIPLYGIVEAPRAVGINTRLPLNLVHFHQSVSNDRSSSGDARRDRWLWFLHLANLFS